MMNFQTLQFQSLQEYILFSSSSYFFYLMIINMNQDNIIMKMDNQLNIIIYFICLIAIMIMKSVVMYENVWRYLIHIHSNYQNIFYLYLSCTDYYIHLLFFLHIQYFHSKKIIKKLHVYISSYFNHLYQKKKIKSVLINVAFKIQNV